MRRFIEEINVRDPEIARRIIHALENVDDYSTGPIYEIDMYEHGRDPLSNRPGDCTTLKVFIREDDV